MATPDPSNDGACIEPAAFAWRSLRWLAAALTGIGLVWLLGFEAVMYRAAPLHARPDAVLGDPRVLPSVAVLALAAAIILRTTALGAPQAVPRRWAAALGLGGVLVAAAWAWNPAALPLLAFHALAVAAFTAGAGAVLNAALVIGLPGTQPEARSARGLLTGIALFAFVFAGSLALVRGGTDGMADLAAQPPLSYLDDLDKVGAPATLFRDFNAMHAGLSEQSQQHPPGALLMVWALSVLVAGSPFGIVLALMALAALAVFPLYGWIATMVSRRAALIAAMLYAVVPGVALFASGTADAAFAPMTLTALYAYARAERNESAAWALSAGALFAAAALLHFAVLTVAVWFVAAGLLHATHTGRFGPVLVRWMAVALGFAALHGALSALTGYSYLDNFRLAWESIHAVPAEAPRAAWYWWPPLTALALCFYAGMPVLILSAYAVRRLPPGPRAMARCGMFVFACLALMYLGTGEGERAAYYTYPFLVLPAALMLDHDAFRRGSFALTAAAMGLCAAQAWIMQAYFQV